MGMYSVIYEPNITAMPLFIKAAINILIRTVLTLKRVAKAIDMSCDLSPISEVKIRTNDVTSASILLPPQLLYLLYK